jgi:protein SCO1/2
LNRILAFSAALLLAVAAPTLANGNGSPAGALKAGEFDPPRVAPDFSLASSKGGTLKLSAYRGKVVLMAFGFTSCPEVCPTTLATLAAARKQLGAAATGVQVVYITVDAERDTARQMRGYLDAFDPSFVGGTGSEAQLAAVRKAYGVNSRKVGAGFAHFSSVFLIDRQGRIRGMMPYDHSPADFAHDARLLLAAKP